MSILMPLLPLVPLLAPPDVVCVRRRCPEAVAAAADWAASSWGTPPDVPLVLPVELLTTMLPPLELPPKKPPAEEAAAEAASRRCRRRRPGRRRRRCRPPPPGRRGRGHEHRRNDRPGGGLPAAPRRRPGVTVRRTTRRVTARRTWACALACFTIAGRGGGFSAAWTAPPPMIAPPHVQAQSFAKAILTDITPIPFLTGLLDRDRQQSSISRLGLRSRCKRSPERKRVNHLVARKRPEFGPLAQLPSHYWTGLSGVNDGDRPIPAGFPDRG